jgi:dTMP kinase
MNITVAIEGLDGAGKHTSTLYVHKALLDAGIDVSSGSFPRYGDTKQSELIQEYLGGLYGEPRSIHPILAGKLFIDERVESIPWIRAKQQASQILLLDRYTPSNIAYQAAKGKDQEHKLEIGSRLAYIEHQFGCVPVADLTIYLKWPVESCVARLKKRAATQDRPIDAIEADVEYLRNVAAIYEDVEFWNEVYSGTYIVIDCTRDGKDLSVSEIGDELTARIMTYYTSVLR